MKNKTCCFTGHRLQKLGLTSDYVKMILEKAIDDFIDKGYTRFISGMSNGVDLWAAEIIMEKKRKNDNLSLICALPYDGFAPSGDTQIKTSFKEIISSADQVEIVNLRYHRGCFQQRNEWMVDNSNAVMAVFNGSGGGTKNTIEYANRKSVKVVNLLDEKSILCF